MKIRSFTKEDILFTEVINDLGFKVVLANLGASIFLVRDHQYVLNRSVYNIKDFKEKDCYYGKTIGPIAGRIKNGEVKIDDKVYQFLLNEGDNALHGGDYGLSKCAFSRKITNNNDIAFSIQYEFLKKKKVNGLPDKTKYIISYYLSAKENILLCDMRAIPYNNTVISLTNHSYFCLGEDNIKNLILHVPSHKFLHPNPNDLLMEEERDIIPCLDFNKKKPIFRDIADKYLQESKTKGYDHFFILDKKGDPITLENKYVKMEIISDFDGAQIYSDNYADGIEVLNSEDKFHRAVAIEPEDNILNLKQINKGQIYHHQIEYRFYKK